MFEDSAKDRDYEEADFMNAIVDENSGDTGPQTTVESSPVHTDGGSVAQSSTGSVNEEGIT